MVKVGHLVRGNVGPRRRAEYRFATHGSRLLRNGWRSLLEEPTKADIDAVLRTATLAKFLGAANKSVISYLQKAARLRAREAKRLTSDAVSAGAAGSDPAVMYAKMRTIYASQQLRCEAGVLRRLAAAFK